MQIATQRAKTAVEDWALSVLETTDDPLTWSSAAWWLANLRTQRAYKPLVRMMWAHIGDEYYPWSVIGAVAQIGGASAVPELREVLRQYPPKPGNERYVESYVAVAGELARLGDVSGRKGLQRAASSPIPKARRKACQTMVYVLGDDARPTLERLANDPDPGVALSAEYGLRELDHQRAAPP
jgi:HEAT repeat protein